VKLTATATALVAALSIFAGCATDNDGEGGAYTAGLRPAKPNADDFHSTQPPAPAPAIDQLDQSIIPTSGAGSLDSLDNTELVAETIASPVKWGNIDYGDAIDVLVNPRDPFHLHVLDDHGSGIACSIWVEDGRVQWTNCSN
jgi:hypothetical protein